MKNKKEPIQKDKEALIKLGSKTAKAGFSNEDDIVIKFNNWQKDADAKEWLGLISEKFLIKSFTHCFHIYCCGWVIVLLILIPIYPVFS